MVGNSVFAAKAGEKLMESVVEYGKFYVPATQEELDILCAVNELVFSTSKMISIYLGIEQENVRRMLKKMKNHKAITGLYFTCDDSTKKSNYMVYRITKRGSAAIRQCLGEDYYSCKLFAYADKLVATEPDQVKRILAGNQALINVLVPAGYKINPCKTVVKVNHSNDSGHVFRAIGLAQKDNNVCIVEPVRRIAGAEDSLLDKIKRIQKTLHSNNILAVNKATLIIVAEDEEHMRHIKELTRYVAGKNLVLKFTYDLGTFPDTYIMEAQEKAGIFKRVVNRLFLRAA